MSNNISISFTSNGVGIGSNTANCFLDMSAGNTAIALPVGNTAQRRNGQPGWMRYNGEQNNFEGYSTKWGTIGGQIAIQNNNVYVNTTQTLDFSNGSNVLMAITDDYQNNRINVYLDALNNGEGGANLSPVVVINTLPANTAMQNGPPSLLGGQLGTLGSPTSNTEPLVSFTKYYSGNSSPTGYQGGAGWFSTYHVAGNTDVKGLTGFAQVIGGTPSSVALHGYSALSANTPGALGWAGWFTSQDYNANVSAQCFGIEIDLVLKTDRSHVTTAIGQNSAVGLWINNQSDEITNANGTVALGITGESGANVNGYYSKWYTGIWMAPDSIVPGATHEGMLINGGIISANAYTAYRAAGYLDQGLDLTGGNYLSTAIFLPNGTANGGYIYAQDGANTSNSYALMYLNNANPNQLVLGQAVPGGIVLDADTQTSNLQVINSNGANTDFGSVVIQRTANYISHGPTTLVPSALRIDSYVANTGNNYEWALTSVMHNSSNTGQQVAVYGQGNKVKSNASPTWGAVFEVQELVPINDPTVGTVGLEVDNRNNGSDGNSNRVGIDLVCAKYNTAPSAANAYTTFGYRLQNNQDLSGNSVIGTAFSVYYANVVMGLDTATSVCTAGAIRIGQNQAILMDIVGNNAIYNDGVGFRYDVGPTNARVMAARFALSNSYVANQLGIGVNTPTSNLYVLGNATITTNATIGSANIGNYGVYQNGAASIVGIANINFNNTATVNVTVTPNDSNQVNVSFSTTPVGLSITTDTFTVAIANQNTFTLTSNVLNENYVLVIRNGLMQVPLADYTLTSNNILTLFANCYINDVVSIRKF